MSEQTDKGQYRWMLREENGGRRLVADGYALPRNQETGKREVKVMLVSEHEYELEIADRAFDQMEQNVRFYEATTRNLINQRNTAIRMLQEAVDWCKGGVAAKRVEQGEDSAAAKAYGRTADYLEDQLTILKKAVEDAN